MNQPLTILGIAGSLRRGSYHRAALRAAQQVLPAGTTLRDETARKLIRGLLQALVASARRG